jgi:hypothetical protein
MIRALRYPLTAAFLGGFFVPASATDVYLNPVTPTVGGVAISATNPLPVSSAGTNSATKVGDGTNSAGVTQSNATGSGSAYGLNTAAELYVFDPSGGGTRPVRTGFNLSGAVGNDIPAVASGGQYNLGLPTLSGGQFAPLQLDTNARLILSPGSVSSPALYVASPPIPTNATLITGSGTGTTGAVSASLAGAVGKLTYICGIDITSTGGTASIGPVTTTGLATNFTWELAAGTQFQRTFSPCVPTSSGNTPITVTTTADGTATAVAVNLNGFQF